MKRCPDCLSYNPKVRYVISVISKSKGIYDRECDNLFHHPPAIPEQEGQTAEQYDQLNVDRYHEIQELKAQVSGLQEELAIVKQLHLILLNESAEDDDEFVALQEEMKRLQVVRDAVYMGLYYKNLSTAAMVELLEQVGAAPQKGKET